MGKNDNKNNNKQQVFKPVVGEDGLVDEVLDTEEPKQTEEVVEVNTETTETEKVEGLEDQNGTDKVKEIQTLTQPEVQEKEIEEQPEGPIDPDADIMSIIDKLVKSKDIDTKVFGSELKDYVTAIRKANAIDSNNANRKLNNLLLRVVKNESYEEFKVKFDIINKLFLDKDIFEASYILYFSEWTKSDKDLANFSQLVTIIEDLSNRETRQANKKRIVNLTNLTIGETAINNIKRYYKI